MNKYYPGRPVNIHIQSLINIIQDNNWIITTKKGKGKLPLFRSNVERVITFYARHTARRMHLVRNREKCKMHNIDWCVGVLQLADIGTKNVSELDITTRMKYNMVRLEN